MEWNSGTAGIKSVIQYNQTADVQKTSQAASICDGKDSKHTAGINNIMQH
jgi:hypothetical protein